MVVYERPGQSSVAGSLLLDEASEMFRSDVVNLVTREGRPAGFFLPWDSPELSETCPASSSYTSPTGAARGSSVTEGRS